MFGRHMEGYVTLRTAAYGMRRCTPTMWFVVDTVMEVEWLICAQRFTITRAIDILSNCSGTGNQTIILL